MSDGSLLSIVLAAVCHKTRPNAGHYNLRSWWRLLDPDQNDPNTSSPLCRVPFLARHLLTPRCALFFDVRSFAIGQSTARTRSRRWAGRETRRARWRYTRRGPNGRFGAGGGLKTAAG